MADLNDARLTIPPTNPALRTMGRIDDTDPDRPIWVFPYTQVSFRFTGTSLAAELINYWNYGDSHLGVIIDGVPSAIRIPSGFFGDAPTGGHDALPFAHPYGPATVTLADRLPDIEHEVTIVKRQDGQHYVQFLGFSLDPGATVMPPLDPAPSRRIAVFGDSVSCGERNEAARYAGQPDPETDLSSYSNAWYSYAAITARNLDAQLHDVSQGGAALLDGIGWFNGPDYIGQESIWNRIAYNPTLGESRPWDATRYAPHVIIVAIGQNDAHPVDFMADDYDGERALAWRGRYVDFLRTLHGCHPQATIICATTVLQHDPAWDRAIGDAVATFNKDLRAEQPDSRLNPIGAHGAPVAYHFLYSRNGAATPGHPRVVEHEEMARELTAFITSLGPAIWQD